MLALITGASSGLGKEIAKLLSLRGYDLVLVGRDKEELIKLKNELKTNSKVCICDLTKEKKVYNLYLDNKNIDLLVNSAGIGEVGYFVDCQNDLKLIDLNIKALHILTKLYLKEFIKNDSGRILNISSSAAFNPGPLMSTYYATKSYVYSLTMGIYEELRRKKSNVKISVACPGAFNSNFLKRANIKKATYVKDTNYIAKYIVDKMFKDKLLIVPGIFMKFIIFISRFIPRKSVLKLNYKIQKKKM